MNRPLFGLYEKWQRAMARRIAIVVLSPITPSESAMAAQQVTLSGRLICVNREQSDIVERHLPVHIELTRAEPGCIDFEVVRTDDPLVWLVDERFADQAAFDTHQRRVADSVWGRATAGIERAYTIRT